jgi:putative transposase
MSNYSKASHAVYDIQYHIIWITKCRYKIFKGPIGERLRELLRQGCGARGIHIIRGSCQ